MLAAGATFPVEDEKDGCCRCVASLRSPGETYRREGISDLDGRGCCLVLIDLRSWELAPAERRSGGTLRVVEAIAEVPLVSLDVVGVLLRADVLVLVLGVLEESLPLEEFPAVLVGGPCELVVETLTVLRAVKVPAFPEAEKPTPRLDD
jgi:hypothetical protein